MVSKSLPAFTFAVLFSGSAFAFHCPADMKKIDEALAANPTISDADLSRVKELRALGEEQHNSGAHGDSVATLAEAMAILGIN